jgi:serine/threonine-protein kinase
MGLTVGEIVLDRYEVEGLVGVGGMGEVYRARHRKLGMPVAVKTIAGNASPELIARFAREASLLARVRHPNVVSILDVGQTGDGSECMVMEFLEGEALDTRLERRGALPWSEVRVIGLSILKGLDAIHGAGIVHRDLKPGNVLAARGNPEVIKLVDFGIAHSSAGQAPKYTRTGAAIGTPAYMAPEQLVGGTVDARGDLYALGLMLYELATGRLPFGDDANGALRRLREDIPAPVAPAALPALPEHAAQALLHALAPEPAQRPQSAREFYAELRGARREGTQAVQATAAEAQPARAGERGPRPPAPPARTHAAAGHAAAPPAHAAVARGAPRAPAARPAAPAAPGPRPAAAAPAPHAPAPRMPAASFARALVAARMPVSRMSREEQKQLAQLAAPGRAYHMGGGVWFAVLSAASAHDVELAAQRLCGLLMQRYGETCRVAWSPASSDFALTPASLSGAAPLPPDIAQLIEHVL